MRQLSRLVSVFLALILMGASLMVVAADDKVTTGANAETQGLDHGAKVVISRVDTESPVYPGTELKFRVLIVRSGHDVRGTAAATYLERTGVTAGTKYIDGDDFTEHNDGRTTAEADKTKDLTEKAPTFSTEFKYKVSDGDLGDNAANRTVDIQFTLTFLATAMDADGNRTNAETHAVTSNTVPVLVEKKPNEGAGSSGVTMTFAGADPDELAAGKKIKFTLTARTGKYGLGATKLVEIMRQRYSDADTKDGDPVTVNFLTIPTLETDSVSNEESVEYVLRQEDIDAHKVEFSVKVEIELDDIRKADGTAVLKTDIHGWTKDTLEGSHVFMSMPPVAATPSPYLYETDAATVMELAGGGAIELTRKDTGSTITLTLGTLSSAGALLPRDSGYIRDESRGQTYAVVRTSDNTVRRVWISSSSEWVPHVPWANVIAFYNVPAAVLNAIPLDDTMPEVDQLVAVDGVWYVYRDRAWRHIPNLSTFRAEGFYWCDLTTADSSHAAASSTATPLPSRVGPPAEGYPACR